MRYEELPGPLEGWTYDEEGTIHTRSGYRCSARILESALWLFQCYNSDARKHLIRSDEAPGATRPLYEIADVKERFGGNVVGLAVEPVSIEERQR